MNRLSRERRAQVIAHLVEKNSIRGTSRLCNVSRTAINALLLDVGVACLDYHDRVIRNLQVSHVEVDEIWSFAYCKERMSGQARRVYDWCGDIWTWMALDADSKLIISWLVGNRSPQCATMLMADLRRRVAGRIQLSTDGLAWYVDAVEEAFGADIDYAQVVKTYRGGTWRDPEGDSERRYSPPRAQYVSRNRITGNPDMRRASTSFVERQNLNLRMNVHRFARLTNAFSKKATNHAAHVSLHMTWHNFCRIHRSLRVTPAMEAGLAGEVRDAEWIADLVEMATPPPGPRGPYRRRRPSSEQEEATTDGQRE